MITELEDKDIERIADKVIERLKPYLKDKGENEKDCIFDVDGLADYLKVKKAWIYEKTHLNDIPFYKVGKFPRFKKRDIDKWLQSQK